MSHSFKRAPGPWALGVALLVCAGPWGLALAQAPTPSALTSAHVHGAQPTAVAAVIPPAVASAPVPASGLARAWQDANRAVAQFPRGHADVLRWEQKNTSIPSDAPVHPDAGQLTLARAMQLALQDQTPWIQPGMGALEVAEARQQAAALRWGVQKLWVDAVAARQSVAHSRDILAVAQAGAELAQRMAQVGNWSRVRQIQEELPLWDAHTRLANAEWQAERALNALWQRIGAGMTVQALAQQLPAHLPVDVWVEASVGVPADLPVKASVKGSAQAPMVKASGPAKVNLDDVAALQAQALQAHLRWPVADTEAGRLMAGLGLSAADLQAATQALSDQVEQAGQDAPVWNLRTLRWGHDFEKAWQARSQADRLARQVRADVQVAVAAYKLARQNAHTSRAEVLRLHTELSQETLLRYNGMLKSTWDLLASARARTERVDAALQAQRQAWLAQADLMAVLAGLPYSASTNGAGASSLSNTSTNSAGH